MRTYLDCIPCFFDQALRASRMATQDEQLIKRLLDELGEMLKEIPLDSPPPMTGRLIYAKVAEFTGNGDPYREIKHKTTTDALCLYPYLKEKVSSSGDRLLVAIKLAIAGNAIDYGPNHGFDMKAEIENALECDLDAVHVKAFMHHLEGAREILYIGDNAGETVFDRILIEELDKPVIYAVRGAPIINDVTYEDAIQAGLDEVSSILSSGTNAPGAILDTCNDQFIEAFHSADLVISKGQGNYEALSDEKRSIFFLFKAKCEVIAKHANTHIGEIVVKGINI